jgi:citrate synthase
MQGAVAAGLLGMGDRFGGPVEGAAKLLQEALQDVPTGADLRPIAIQIVSEHGERRKPISGLGHPVHKEVDPRTPKLFALAAENGLSGRHVELMKLVSEEASRRYGRPLPINATGAIGAIASELGLPWRVCRGLAVMARAIGLVAHIQEEIEEPLAAEMWSRIDDESSSHLRPDEV